MSPLDPEAGNGPLNGAFAPLPSPDEPRPWLGVVEALLLLLACLATALAVGGLELILLAPRVHEIEFRLYEGGGGKVRADPDLLMERVQALGLPGRVERTERKGQPAIVIRGLDSIDPAESRVKEVLEQSGYRRIDPDVRSGPDPEALLRDYPALTLATQAAVLIAFGLVLARLRVRRVRARVSSPMALFGGVLAGVLGFLGALLVSAIQHLLGWSIEEQPWILELLRDRETLATVLPLVVLLMPVSEEMLFRGYLFRFLLERSGVRTAYLVSAVSFSAVHLHLPGVPTYFIVGLLFAHVCRRTGTLAAPIAGHVTYNGLALGLSLLAPGGL